MPGPLSPAGRQKVLLILGAAVLIFAGGVLFRTFSVAREVGAGGTYPRVRSLLVRRLNADPRAVRPEAALDSVAPGGIPRLELAEAIREEFQVEMTEQDTAGLATVQELVETIDRGR